MAGDNPLHDSLFGSDADPRYKVRVEAFEGPLDLLLHLIGKSEIDIYNIPIATITRQYLDYLELMKELNLDIAGEFLVMASTLVQIKSKMLLPALPDEEMVEEEGEDPRAELVRRLLEYQKYRDAAGTLSAGDILGRDVFARKFTAPELADLEPGEATVELELFVLVDAFQRLLATVPAGSFHEVGAERISVADRIAGVLELLQGREAVTFEEMFTDFLTREYVIATFLALLELCKLRMVRISQMTSFGSIWIMPAVSSHEPVTEGEDDHARLPA